MNLLIQREDAYDFLDCWRQAIHRRSYRSRVRPYDETKGALVFSFDIEMKPFLGDHWGWNRPEARTYFYQTPTLIETIAQIMLIFPDRDAGVASSSTTNRPITVIISRLKKGNYANSLG